MQTDEVVTHRAARLMCPILCRSAAMVRCFRLAVGRLRQRGFIQISTSRVRAIGVAAVLLSALVLVGVAERRDTIAWSQDPRLSTWPAVAARILESPLAGKGFGREIMKKGGGAQQSSIGVR